MSFDNTPSQEPAPPTQQVNVRTPIVKPIVTYILMGITILLYLGQVLIQALMGYDLLFIFGGKINDLIIRGQLWRLITPAFLHSNFLHISFNMYALFILGRRIESTYGHWRFLWLYLLSAFGGNVLSFVLSDANSLGSSTAIFGLLAAEGMFIWQNRKLFGARSTPMLNNIVVILVINLIIGFMPGSNIDYFGHLGGLLAGFLFAAMGGPKWVFEGIPPFVTLKDSRPKRDVLIAVIIVLIGFIVMALIPFVTK